MEQAVASPGKITSNFGRYKDFTPHLYAAGKILTDPGDSVEACIKQARKDRPGTPDNIKPYRKSFNMEPGRINTHYGKAFDPPPPNVRFGVVSDHTETSQTLIQPTQESAFAARQQELKEGVFLSSKREPLGRSKSNGITLPVETQNPKHRFGCKTIGSESAKNLMYPREDDNMEEENHRRYVATHGAYEAGEQRSRNYNWNANKIDPGTFRFGKKEKESNEGGVSAALKPEHDGQLKTVIVRKAVEDFKDVTHDTLAQPKNLGFGGRNVTDGHAFGKQNRYDDWGARECIRGRDNPELCEPDKDLGKSIKPGTRNFTDDPRVFGLPTIRSDVKKPGRKRVTDFQNYGDEPKAVGVMYPSKFMDDDVYEEDFLQPIDKATMAQLLVTSKEEISEQDFDMAWNLAADKTSNGTVCVETFRQAMEELGL